MPLLTFTICRYSSSLNLYSIKLLKEFGIISILREKLSIRMLEGGGWNSSVKRTEGKNKWKIRENIYIYIENIESREMEKR